MSRYLCGCIRDNSHQHNNSLPHKKYNEVHNPLFNDLEERNVRIQQLEGLLKVQNGAKAEADALRRQLQALSEEKTSAAASAAKVKEQWAVAVREKEDLIARQAASESKIADLHAQIEMHKDIVQTLQRERERMREQQQQQPQDDSLRQALDELAAAKAAVAGLEQRIDADRADIELLQAQVRHLGAAKEDAEARVRALEEALAAEVAAHGHEEQLSERVGFYEREIEDMRAQVANLRDAKLAADRCISDLETMLNREQRDGVTKHAHVAELQERVAGLGASFVAVEATPAKTAGDMVATPLTAGSNASTDVVTPVGRAAPAPASPTAGSPGTVDHNLVFGAVTISAVKAVAMPRALKKAAAFGSELDQLTELQLEVVIAQLEGQLVSLESELSKNRADVAASGRMQKDYESRICDLENRLQLTTEENAHLQRFLVEVTEAMEKAAMMDTKMDLVAHVPGFMPALLTP